MERLERELLAATPSLRRLALSLVSDEHAAGDLVQEAWLAALLRREDSPRDPARWAQVVVRHLRHGLRRSDDRRRTREMLSVDAKPSPAPDTLLERSQTLRGVASAAAEIDEPYRTVIRLRYWEDLSPPDIAARLDRPVDTVKTQLRRGLETLRERLDREHGGDRRAWMAPLVLLLDVDELPSASTGFTIGAAAAAAAVPVALWLGWALLRGEAEPAPPAAKTVASDPAATATSASDRIRVSSVDRAVVSTEAYQHPALLETQPSARRLAVAVVDGQGRPVSAAEVHIARADGFRLRGRTDQRGALELALEEEEVGTDQSPEFADRAILYAYKSGYAASWQYGVRCEPEASAGVRLVLPGPELVIRGLVVDAHERPIPAARVQVESADLKRRQDGDLIHWERHRNVRGDASGWFTIVGLVPGVHQLAVYAPGSIPSAETADGRLGGEVEIRVVLAEAGEVTGIVRDEGGNPVPEAVLSYDLDERLPGSVARETRADPDGHFLIRSLPPGRHMIWAQDPERSGRVCRAWVDVTAGTPAIWNPVLERANGIRVRVVDDAGIPMEGWSVLLMGKEDSRIRTAETGADGRAAVYDVPPTASMEVHVRREILTDRFPRAALTGIGPAPDEHTLVVSHADSTGSIGGTLLDDRDRPPVGASLFLISTEVWHGVSEPIDPLSGEFSITGIADGTYDLMVIWDGHGHLNLDQVEVADGAPVYRGVIRLPATGRVLIDWSWPRDTAHADLHYHLYQGTYVGAVAKVSDGSAPPPEAFDLLPGPYFLVVERDVALQYRRFEVESGREVRVESGPGLGNN